MLSISKRFEYHYLSHGRSAVLCKAYRRSDIKETHVQNYSKFLHSAPILAMEKNRVLFSNNSLGGIALHVLAPLGRQFDYR